MEEIVGQYCTKGHWRFSGNLVETKKRGQSTTQILGKKMSELVQGQLLGINVIRDSGNGVGTLCFRERYSPQQLPTSTAGTHHPKALDWKKVGFFQIKASSCRGDHLPPQPRHVF